MHTHLCLWKLLVLVAVNCGKKLIDQSFRCIDDMFGSWKSSAFYIVDIVAKTFDSLHLDCLLHLEEVPVLFGVSWIRRSVIAQDILRKHELNVTATACAD